MTTHDQRRRREHNVRAAYRRFGWRTMAHRHRRRKWHKALRGLCGRLED